MSAAPNGSYPEAGGARRPVADVLQELSDVIEAVRGERDLIRVSGLCGNAQDVGVVGIDSLQETIKRACAELTANGAPSVAGRIGKDIAIAICALAAEQSSTPIQSTAQISELDDASNACLELAAKHGYATGHGDTVADMIREFSAQIPIRVPAQSSADDPTPSDYRGEIGRLRQCISMAMGCLDPLAQDRPDEALAWYRLLDAMEGREPRSLLTSTEKTGAA